MHHVIVERWSRRTSWLHGRDARVKLAAALALIVAAATTSPSHYAAAICYVAFVGLATLAARLPLLSIAWRAAFVLPFSATFATASWLAGDPAHAASLVWKSYLSAYTVLLLVSSTPLVELLRALEWFRVPGLLILIAQFLYRYLFVISEQAQHMRLAAQCRAGGRRRWTFQGAASALSVLFVRSYARAEGIQRSMDARGFTGRFPAVSTPRFTWIDGLFGTVAIIFCAGVRAIA